VDDGVLSLPYDRVPATVTVERPKNPEHGDYATNVALQISKPAGSSPRAVAELVAVRLREVAGVAAVDVAGPGFLNVTLSAQSLGEHARSVVVAAERYGHIDALAGKRINVEFISANPTGPIHLGHTRWAAVGDSLRRILAAAGAKVSSEHYINDAGAQVDRFARSLLAAARGEPTPEDGYPGEYVTEIARQIVAEHPDALTGSDPLAAFAAAGYKIMLGEMRASLERFGVHFDVWFSEKTLHDGGAVEHALDELRQQGHVYEADGAIWLRTTDFTDDKDRVLIRSNGEKTYFAADAAYYINKRERGFDKCIYLLGADHHGYVNRLKAIAACAGDDPDFNIEILIGQLVSLVQGGQPVKLSKRAGSLITLDEIVEAVGVDAARYSLARSSTDSPLTLDLDEITRNSNDNPVHYVRYAHARIASLMRNAAELGVALGNDFDASLLSHERETDLLKALGDFPGVVATAAELREPHRIARYLEDLAAAYHRFYDACRVLPQGDEVRDAAAMDLTTARLWLVEASRIVLANGLALLGVSAPERM
jgi:arginyl-tRNA synthetase